MIRQIFILILYNLMCLLTVSVNCLENWPSGEIKGRHKTVTEGQDVTISCAGRVKDAPAFWDYKACGIGVNRSLCSEISAEELNSAWTPLVQNTSTLTLNNVTMPENGLYRCKHAATPLIYIYTTVHLEVLPHNTEVDDSLKFEEGLPKDLKVTKNSQAVFQCRVYSKTPISLIWAWMNKENEAELGKTPRLDRWAEVLRKVPQTGKMYEALGAPGENSEIGYGKPHLNRLVLPRVRRAHTGRYYCIAFNATGYFVGEASAYLQVVDEEHTWKSYMYRVFLLPFCIVFIVLVLLMGFCLFIIKRRRRVDSPAEDLENAEL